MEIRPATIQDEDAIFFLLLEMAEENSKEPISVEKALSHIRMVLTQGGCVVAVHGDKIVGSIGVCKHSAWFSKREHWGDSWYYVSKDYRKSRVAFKMKKAIETFAANTGHDLIFAIYSEVDAERKVKIFERDSGYKCLGGTYKKAHTNGMFMRNTIGTSSDRS